MNEIDEEIQEYLDEYDELFPTIQKSEDSLYPEWLFKPVFNDFDDNYFEQSFVEDSLKASIMKLKHRYNDFYEYLDAVDTYNEYMDRMVDKYGSMRVIKNSIAVGMLEDPIPAKPKLKQSKKNMRLLKTGFIPTRKIPEFQVSGEELLAIARQAYPVSDIEDLKEEDTFKKPTKKQLQQLARIKEKMDGADRRRNMYRSVASNAGTDFIVEYLNQAKRGVYGVTGEEDVGQRRSIFDIENEINHEKNTRPELLKLEEESLSKTVIHGTRIVRGIDQVRAEVYKTLYQEGFDIIGKMGRGGLNKESIKLVRSELGISAPASKKELKAMKKRAKKEQARMARRADAESLLERTLLGNKIDTGNVSRDSNGNLAFRLKDLYKD